MYTPESSVNFKKGQSVSLWSFPGNTLSLQIPLLALTNRLTDRESNTLASRGLEEPFFQLCCMLCQFLVLAGNRFWFYILLMYLEYHTAVMLCYFFIQREIVFVLRIVHTQCTIQFCGGKVNFVRIFLLNPNFLLVHKSFSKISRFSTALYPQLFRKISRTFNSSRKS